MKTIALAFALAFLSPAAAIAQDSLILEGFVVDRNLLPLPGAVVTLAIAGKADTTNANGAFRFTWPNKPVVSMERAKAGRPRGTESAFDLNGRWRKEPGVLRFGLRGAGFGKGAPTHLAKSSAAWDTLLISCPRFTPRKVAFEFRYGSLPPLELWPQSLTNYSTPYLADHLDLIRIPRTTFLEPPGGGLESGRRFGATLSLYYPAMEGGDEYMAFLSGYGIYRDGGSYGDWYCQENGSCSLGGILPQFGNMTRNGGMGFVMTQDFLPVPEGSDSLIQTRRSAMKWPVEVPPGPGWVLEVDYAFLSGDKDSGEAFNDTATISFAGTKPLVLDRNALQPQGVGPLTDLAKPGGCGTYSNPNVGPAYSYPLCTDWRIARFEIPQGISSQQAVYFMVHENTKNQGAVALLFDNIRLHRKDSIPASYIRSASRYQPIPPPGKAYREDSASRIRLEDGGFEGGFSLAAWIAPEPQEFDSPPRKFRKSFQGLFSPPPPVHDSDSGLQPAFGWVSSAQHELAAPNIERQGLKIPDGPIWMRFDYAFFTADSGTGEATNDSAWVTLHLPGSNGDSVIPLLVIDRNTLQPGGAGVPRQGTITSGCGNAEDGTRFSMCTGWRNHAFDLSALAGRTVTLRVEAREAVDNQNSQPVALAVDNFHWVRPKLVDDVLAPE